MPPPYKRIQDSLGVWIPRRGFRILGLDSRFLTMECGFRIPIVCGIPDSLSCILDFEAEDLDTTSETFPDFGILQAKIYSRIRIPLLLFHIQVKFIYNHPHVEIWQNGVACPIPPAREE